LKDIENRPVDQSRLALDRLREALARLERAAGRRPASGPAGGDALRAEHDDLKQRHAALQKSASQVATRLDDAIARLATFIGSES